VAGGTPWKVRVLEKVWIELLIKFIYIRLIGSENPHFWKYALFGTDPDRNRALEETPRS
jgi:hypothetical protein